MMLLLCNLVAGGFAIMVTTVVVPTAYTHTHTHTEPWSAVPADLEDGDHLL